MVTGETFHHHAGKFVFLAHEDPFFRDKHVVENHQGFVTAKLRVAKVDVGIGFKFAGVAGLASVDHQNAFGIRRNGKRNGVVFVFLFHRHSGHDEVFVRVHGTGLVGLGTAHHDTVFSDLYNVEVQVGIGLL